MACLNHVAMGNSESEHYFTKETFIHLHYCIHCYISRGISGLVVVVLFFFEQTRAGFQGLKTTKPVVSWFQQQ